MPRKLFPKPPPKILRVPLKQTTALLRHRARTMPPTGRIMMTTTIHTTIMITTTTPKPMKITVGAATTIMADVVEIAR